MLLGLGGAALWAAGVASSRAAMKRVEDEPPRAPPPPPLVVLTPDEEDVEPPTLEEQRRRLFARMEEGLGLSADRMAAVEAIFAASPVLGQGNPALTLHPMSRSECRRIRREAGVGIANEPSCGAPGMVRLEGPGAEERGVCIDQLEFPNLPCEYPVVHVRAREAAELCRAVGKRICDAHEWEGACAGSVGPAQEEYVWGRPRRETNAHHNVTRQKVWSHGPAPDRARCAMGSWKTPGCPGGGWDQCGSNTYPAGAFPGCASPFGVYDMHGNVAEHMNLPTSDAERGGGGYTEMKGSWFVFARMQVHEDDCRWRAPRWHETRVMSKASHYNYHLGFRCCKDAGEGGGDEPASASVSPQ
jgi:hypothetical protein